MAQKRRKKPSQPPKAEPRQARSTYKLIVLPLSILLAIVASWALYARHHTVAATQTAEIPAESTVEFGPTVPNTTPAPGPAPQGMAWIPGGEFSMGAHDPP